MASLGVSVITIRVPEIPLTTPAPTAQAPPPMASRFAGLDSQLRAWSRTVWASPLWPVAATSDVNQSACWRPVM